MRSQRSSKWLAPCLLALVILASSVTEVSADCTPVPHAGIKKGVYVDGSTSHSGGSTWWGNGISESEGVDTTGEDPTDPKITRNENGDDSGKYVSSKIDFESNNTDKDTDEVNSGTNKCMSLTSFMYLWSEDDEEVDEDFLTGGKRDWTYHTVCEPATTHDPDPPGECEFRWTTDVSLDYVFKASALTGAASSRAFDTTIIHLLPTGREIRLEYKIEDQAVAVERKKNVVVSGEANAETAGEVGVSGSPKAITGLDARVKAARSAGAKGSIDVSTTYKYQKSVAITDMETVRFKDFDCTEAYCHGDKKELMESAQISVAAILRQDDDAVAWMSFRYVGKQCTKVDGRPVRKCGGELITYPDTWDPVVKEKEEPEEGKKHAYNPIDQRELEEGLPVGGYAIYPENVIGFVDPSGMNEVSARAVFANWGNDADVFVRIEGNQSLATIAGVPYAVRYSDPDSIVEGSLIGSGVYSISLPQESTWVIHTPVAFDSSGVVYVEVSLDSGFDSEETSFACVEGHESLISVPKWEIGEHVASSMSQEPLKFNQWMRFVAVIFHGDLDELSEESVSIRLWDSNEAELSIEGELRVSVDSESGDVVIWLPLSEESSGDYTLEVTIESEVVLIPIKWRADTILGVDAE